MKRNEEEENTKRIEKVIKGIIMDMNKNLFEII